jgi:hypothetical protein
VTHLVGGDDMFGRIAAVSGGLSFDSVRFSGFAAFHSTAASSIAAAEAVGLRPRGLYGSSEVQALFSIAEGNNRLLGGGVPVSAQARLAVRDPEIGRCPRVRPANYGLTRLHGLSAIWKIPSQPNKRSPPTECSAPAISAASMVPASFMRRGSAMPCGSADSSSVPRKSKP